MIIVLSGCLGRLPLGGHAWAHLQYLVGLHAGGHEVYYLEDAGAESWVYDWDSQEFRTDLEYPGAYIKSCLEPFGLGDRWAYRAGDHSRGIGAEALREICSQADLLLVFASPLAPWRDEYDLPRRRAFVDVDPGFVQMRVANGEPALQETIARCERLFTVGQRIGAADCEIPTLGRHWWTTVPPVVLSEWPVASDGEATHFTSVMQWGGYPEVVFDGARYGTKADEFWKFVDLPCRTTQPLQIALTGGQPEALARQGWDVVEGWVPSRTPWSYRSFIQRSRAEFSVAKHGYVRTRGGWFSDRSVCYLASGRPVLVQDTGLSDWLPVGEGVLAFDDVRRAALAIEAVNAAYPRHQRAARRIAETYFASDRVLPELLEAALG